MNLDDDILLVKVPTERRVLQMACYATHLCSGSTYHHKRVTSGTVTAYLAAAATLIADACGQDPRKWSAADAGSAKEISAVLAEYKRWESMPDRREPWTPEMQDNLDSYNVTLASRDDAKHVAIADFTAAGLQVGYRVSEYAQSDITRVQIGTHVHDIRTREAVAFTLRDVRFFNRKRPVALTDIVQAATVEDAVRLLTRAQLNFSIQKNGTRNEEQDYVPNDVNPRLCVVRRFVRIVRRFVALLGYRDDLPVSIYRDSDGTVKYITRSDIDAVLQATAIRVFKLDPKNPKHLVIIKKWTTHSVRVGACNILYGDGTPSHEIQHRLRWRSMSFMAYFRNLGVLSEKQNQAVNRAFANPEEFS